MAIWHVVVRVTMGRKIITFPRFASRRGSCSNYLFRLLSSHPPLEVAVLMVCRTLLSMHDPYLRIFLDKTVED